MDDKGAATAEAQHGRTRRAELARPITCREAITTPEGPRAAADHPGYPGRHMLSRAAQEVEVEFDTLAQPKLREWATAAEANASRRRGIT